jgi:hypothetical protein
MSDALRKAAEKALEPLPCPFCGGHEVTIVEGGSFRWRLAQCCNCGAQSGEVRVQTLGDGTKEEWEAQAERNAIAEWNTRAALAAPQELPPEMIEAGYIAMYRAVTGDTETTEHEIAETYRAMIGARKP